MLKYYAVHSESRHTISPPTKKIPNISCSVLINTFQKLCNWPGDTDLSLDKGGDCSSSCLLQQIFLYLVQKSDHSVWFPYLLQDCIVFFLSNWGFFPLKLLNKTTRKPLMTPLDIKWSILNILLLHRHEPASFWASAKSDDRYYWLR